MKRAGALFLSAVILVSGCAHKAAPPPPVVMNDVHSRLNASEVAAVLYPRSTEELSLIVKQAKLEGKSISISGGRHAMGGQQFGAGTLHISMNQMDDVISLDKEKGIVRAEAGIYWPKLIGYLVEAQEADWPQWGIVQKQTGADRMSLGGALSANIHGRGMRMKPIIQDVESFKLVNAEGEVLNVSRTENPELFSLVIGGYGLFGVIAEVDLRLTRRIKLQRIVEILSIEELPGKVNQRLIDGYVYGDFQYKTDEQAEDFMKTGVFSTYRRVSDDVEIPESQPSLSPEKWRQFLKYAHTDKGSAFQYYKGYYLSTHGGLYWSDTHQMSYYDDQYIEFLRGALPADYPEGSLMITEVYVPRRRITEFIKEVTAAAKKHKYNIIYGTMRLIQKDEESFLAWAREDYACIIFNLRVDHTAEGRRKAEENFKQIIDIALSMGGSYYLTYHRWARKDQVLAAYPQFPEFMRLKQQYDPEERFQSDWYRHYKKMLKMEIIGANLAEMERKAAEEKAAEEAAALEQVWERLSKTETAERPASSANSAAEKAE